MAVAVFCCWGAIVGRAGSDGTSLYCGTLNGTNYWQTIDYSYFPGSPKWNQEKDECPLSAKDAIAAARSSLRGPFPHVAGWNVIRISLSPLGDSGAWYYTIWLRPAGALRITNEGARIMVTLDGMVPPLIPNDI